jgi:hypothetical protein
LLDSVRRLQPQAEIYIQSLTPVTKAQSESGSKFNNVKIRDYNKALMKLALEKQAHYVNIYEALEDSEGIFPRAPAMTEYILIKNIIYNGTII